MNTGAQIRPIWSRRVGATKRGSCASTIISASSSAASAVAVGGATAGAAPTHALATLSAPRRLAVRSERQPTEELAFKRTPYGRSIALGWNAALIVAHRRAPRAGRGRHGLPAALVNRGVARQC